MFHARSINAAVIVALILALSVVAGASAGTYTIYNCPSAPYPNGSAGPWNVFSTGSPYTQKASCSGGLGDFIGPLAGSIGPNTSSGVILYAPSGITITYIKVYWYAADDTNGTPIFGDAYAGGTLMGEGYAPVDHSYTADHFELPAGSTSFNLQDYCSSGNGPNGCVFPSSETPMLKMLGSAIMLSDETPPTGQATGGDLFSSGETSGTQSLSYSASDGLAGVASVALLVDGSVVATNNSSCPYDNYLACPASVTGSITWNTASVADGPYEIALQVTNAAGDTTLVDDHAIAIDNRAVQEAKEAREAKEALEAKEAKEALEAKQKKEAEVKAAKEAAEGKGAKEAQEAKVAKEVAEAKKLKEANEAKEKAGTDGSNGTSGTSGATGTGVNGANGVNGSNGSNGSVAILVPSSDLGSILLGSNAKWVISLRVSPLRVRRYSKIKLSGVVSTSPRPGNGKLVYLQARSVGIAWKGKGSHRRRVTVYGKWLTFQAFRAKSNGTFSSTYTFKLGGKHVYQFQSVCPAEGQYRNPTGTSGVVTVGES